MLLPRLLPISIPNFACCSSSSLILRRFLVTTSVNCQQQQQQSKSEEPEPEIDASKSKTDDDVKGHEKTEGQKKDDEQFEQEQQHGPEQPKKKRPVMTEKKQRKGGVVALWDQALRTMGLSRVRNPEQTNVGYAHPRGGYEVVDPEVPLEVLLKEGPGDLKRQLKMLYKEMRGRWDPKLPHFNVQLDRNRKGVKHGETDIRYTFRTEEDMAKWEDGSDSANGEGYSKCTFSQTDRGTAIFEGTLSTRLVKDGRTERAGWCAIRSLYDTHAFNRKKRNYDWDHYTHVLIKCRGDGRSYKLMLHVPQFYDVTWGESYSYPLHTHGGPYWQYEMIPFSRFIQTTNGRISDLQWPVDQFLISSVGITLMDRIDGPFRLEIAFIGATKHSAHLETHAYEKYNIPLGHPEM